MAALTLCSLLLMSVVCAIDGSISCYDCFHTTSSGTPTDATLLSLVTFAIGGDASTCDHIVVGSTVSSTCSTSMCNKLDIDIELSVASESVTLHTLARGCHSQTTLGSTYTAYNTAGCHDYDTSNPYAVTAAAVYAAIPGLTDGSVTGTDCLCATALCNGAPVLGASVIGALLLALMSIFASN